MLCLLARRTLTPKFGLIIPKTQGLKSVKLNQPNKIDKTLISGNMNTSLGPPTAEPKIVVLSRAGLRENAGAVLDTLRALPKEARIIFRGSSAADFSTPKGIEALRQADVILNLSEVGGAEPKLLQTVWPYVQENLKWIETITAGMETVLFPELVASNVVCTNAKGIYSSPLAEHAIMSIIYFAKDVPRWKNNQKARKWERYPVSEARGSTLGILGFGNIGRACGLLAKSLGMKVLAQRRRPELCAGDEIVDGFYGPEGIGNVIEKSDYICVTAPLTPETKGMVGAAELAKAKPSAVIINLGRGSLIDETALVLALKNGQLRGASLDVFETEPLPESSPLWDMDNVLLSPHSTDFTVGVWPKAIGKFMRDVTNFINGTSPESHIVDKAKGY